MERESFEVDDIAHIMNEYFICIKVDREERPDIDQVYMDAVQALGINGGWPLNVFLTPDQKPFFGGTYFSPTGWVQVLQNIQRAYRENPKKLNDTAEELHQHLLRPDTDRFKQKTKSNSWQEDFDALYATLASRFDNTWGGMDRAPKFVMPSVWRLLLRYHHLTKESAPLDQVRLTLNKIQQGGIYDQIGGGFARYSVDGQWFAPHFEKMLYDNAQLLSLYAEAYAVTQDEEYKKVVVETVEWLLREMTHEDGGFYSALDADSEGVEGQFYVWKKSTLREVLGDDEEPVASYFGVTAQGNWEHGNNILYLPKTDVDFLKDHNLDDAHWASLLANAKRKLLAHRNTRIRPGLDDKILTGWNAMMICGLVDAYRVFGDTKVLDVAIRNARFLESALISEGRLYRSYKGRRSTMEGFLDDYAFFIQALLDLYQVTFDEYWISRAGHFIEYVIRNFFDPNDNYFFYSAHHAEKLITRKKEIFDNVIPSSNSVMARNLFLAGTLLDNDDWKKISISMSTNLGHLIRTEPNYMSYWAIAAAEKNIGITEVLFLGDGVQKLRANIHRYFFPYVTIQGAVESSSLPLFEGKVATPGKDTIYVCRNKTCQLPVHTLDEAMKQIVQP
jgi:hypothetical protein